MVTVLFLVILYIVPISVTIFHLNPENNGRYHNGFISVKKMASSIIPLALITLRTILTLLIDQNCFFNQVDYQIAKQSVNSQQNGSNRTVSEIEEYFFLTTPDLGITEQRIFLYLYASEKQMFSLCRMRIFIVDRFKPLFPKVLLTALLLQHTLEFPLQFDKNAYGSYAQEGY